MHTHARGTETEWEHASSLDLQLIGGAHTDKTRELMPVLVQRGLHAQYFRMSHCDNTSFATAFTQLAQALNACFATSEREFSLQQRLVNIQLPPLIAIKNGNNLSI